ncbi:hypothetical protein DDE82_004485 [Stemphylium lycopersici]|nr:hypothetical protein TW65_05293 [Stemphylium lycopersici]RAR04529.1 hypothetical protein DDE82_004485 [Stemphylium lycopersici]
MSYQTYGSSQYHHRQSNEYGAARRKRGKSSRHQHAAWSSDYISEPVYSSSDDYIRPPNQHPTSAQYESPSMSSAYRPRQRGPTLDQTSSPYQPGYEPRRTARQRYRSPSPGPDYMAQSVRTQDEYIATPARTIPGAFVDETPEYSPEYNEYGTETSSPLQHSAPRDYDGRREVHDSPPYVERSHRQHPKNGGWGQKSGFQQSHGVGSHKLEDYQEAKQFLDRLHAFHAQNNRRDDDPSDEEYDHSDEDSDWHDQHAYNARCHTPDDFQAVKEALERIRAIGAPKPPPTKAEYAPRDENINKKNKRQSAAPRRRPKEPKEPRIPTEQRRWDAPNTSRRRAPQPRLDDYREAKQFLACFQALEANSKREEEEAERSDEEEYISESTSENDYPRNEPRKQIAYNTVVDPEPEQQQRWDVPHGAARRSRRELFDTYPAPSTTFTDQPRSPSPPASDLASYRSAVLSGPPSRFPSTERSYRSRSPSVHSQASDCCSIPPSASASAPQSPRIQTGPQTFPPPLPSYSSFSRPPLDKPRPRGRSHSQASDCSSIQDSASRSASPAPAPSQGLRHKQPPPTLPSYPYSCSSFSRPPQDGPRSRSQSRNNGIPIRTETGRSPSRTRSTHSDSDDNGIAEGSDYLPSDTDPGSDNEHNPSRTNKAAKHTTDGAVHSDDNGIGEGSDYLSTDDDDDAARSDICSARGGAAGGRGVARGVGGRQAMWSRKSESGDDDYDDEGDYMSAEDEELIGERYYGR